MWWGGWGSNPRPRDHEAIYLGKRGNSRHEWPGRTTLDTGRVPRVSAFRPTASHELEARARRDRAAALMHRESVALTLSQGGEETQTRVAHKSLSTRSPARCVNQGSTSDQSLPEPWRYGPPGSNCGTNPGSPGDEVVLVEGSRFGSSSIDGINVVSSVTVAIRLRVGAEALLNRSGPPRRRLR